ncbi:MAG: SH3 domain-containing protein [Anaerolineae bacterium]
MRGLLVLLMMGCGWLTSLEMAGRQALVVAEREWLALQVYAQPPLRITPTPFNRPAPLLQPGMNVRVQMREGEWLNLRESPGLQGRVITMLRDKTRLTLVEGPVEVDGLRWWRVRTRWQEGWCVEQAGDTLALVVIDTDSEAEADER